MAIQLANFYYFLPKIVIDPEWSVQIESKCGAEALNSKFAEKSLIQTGLVTLGFGAYFGLVMQSYHFNGQKDHEEPVDRRAMSAVMRLLVYVVLLLPGIFIYGLNFLDIQSDVVILIFGQILAIFTITFIPFYYGDRCCKRFQLLVDKTTWQQELVKRLMPDDEQPKMQINE